METLKEIIYLKEKLGGWKELAEMLGVTERRLQQLRNGDKPGKPLGKLIHYLYQFYRI